MFSRTLFDDKVDMIGFDPRGIGMTNPIKCYSESQFPNYLDTSLVFGASYLPSNHSAEQLVVFDAYSKLSATLCDLNTGEFLKFVSTANVARDMDLMRTKLGLDKMDYFGISYGTYIGSVYANMFPQNVGNMIIDGIVDVTAFR
jgi:pimeloyl-ACP methyl ester carboxylesterase